MINISILKKICKLKGVICNHFDEDCITCMKRKDLIKSKDDLLEIHELLIYHPVEFKRYYNREITRADVIDIDLEN
ncbi:hypothetical protein LCGC14_0838940 [marine sediment metagenome]|uniref:Uncharacterized protein n=1 Tax=marine sediment metagenome TaxID=412755 RepID=A0A0F9PDQ6_9ZZZZ